MRKVLPVYDIILTDESAGVGMISLVDSPAIGVDWIKLSKQEPNEKVIMALKRQEEVINFDKVTKALERQQEIVGVTLNGVGLSFGCPPNGDGKRTDGEPDKRCAEKGAGKSGAKVVKPGTSIKDIKNPPLKEAPIAGKPKVIDIGIKNPPLKDAPKSGSPKTVDIGIGEPALKERVIKPGKITAQDASSLLGGKVYGSSIDPEDDFELEESSPEQEDFLARARKNVEKRGLSKEFGVKKPWDKAAAILSGETVKLDDNEWSSLVHNLNYLGKFKDDGTIEKNYKAIKTSNPGEFSIERSDGWIGSSIMTINEKDKTIKTKPYSVDRTTGQPRKIDQKLMGTDKSGGINFDNEPFYMEHASLLSQDARKVKSREVVYNYTNLKKKNGKPKQLVKIKVWRVG